MAKLDWRNIDWAELAKSNVIRGNAVAIIAGSVLAVSMLTGQHIDPNSQQAIAQGVNQVADGIVSIIQGITAISVVLGAVWSLFHRLVAQAEDAATIIPKKDDSSPPAQKASQP
jgi:hypothetical protein